MRGAGGDFDEERSIHNRRSVILGGTAAAAALGLAACGGTGAGSGGPDPDAAPEDQTVGVAMPTQTYERWVADGNNIKKGLEDKGFTVDMQYADDDIPTQQQQIDQMINSGVSVLLIASIDGASLLRTMRTVLLPMVAPGVAATALICVIFAWNEFFFALNLTAANAATVPIFLMSTMTSEGLFLARLSAASVLASLPVVLAGWIAQKQLVRGLSMGAVK